MNYDVIYQFATFHNLVSYDHVVYFQYAIFFLAYVK